MVFELRPTTERIRKALWQSYARNSKMALLTVKTGGGKTYGAIHTFGSIPKFKNATLLVFTTAKVRQSMQWETSVSDYNQVMQTHLKVICYNYDKIISQKFINILFKRLSFVAKDPIILILDEVHRIKLAGSGKLSKRAKVLLKLAKQDYIVTTLGLSATAISNSYLDIAPYLIMAGYYRNKTQYLRENVKYFNRYHQPIVTNRQKEIDPSLFYNPQKLDQQLKSISVYVDTSVYKPNVHYYHAKFKLNSADRYCYNEIERAYENSEYEYPIQARMDQEERLADVVSWQKDSYLLGIINARNKNKFKQKTPILIFYQYNVVYKHLYAFLKYYYPDFKIRSINGRVKLDSTDLKKPSDENTLILIQYEAGGEGLDWQWSNLSIFYEAPVRYEKYVQAQGRNVRNRDQMKEVWHFSLEYVNTLDGERWQVNRNKKDFTDTLSKKLFLSKLTSK